MPVNLNGVEVTPRAHLDSIEINGHLWPLNFFRFFNAAPGIIILREKDDTKQLETISIPTNSWLGKLLSLSFRWHRL